MNHVIQLGSRRELKARRLGVARARRYLIPTLVSAACAATVAGCGAAHTKMAAGSGLKRIINPYCLSHCAKVSGHVEACLRGTSGCHIIAFSKVTLLNARREVVAAEQSGTTGPPLRGFSLTYPDSGRFTLEAELPGERAARKVTLSRGHSTSVDLFIRDRK